MASVRYVFLSSRVCFCLISKKKSFFVLLFLAVVSFANERNMLGDGECTVIASIFIKFNTSANIRIMTYCKNFVSPRFTI